MLTRVIVSEGIGQHDWEHDDKQGRNKYTPLLHTILDGKGLRQVAIIMNSSLHSIMKLLHYCDKFLWTTILSHDFP